MNIIEENIKQLLIASITPYFLEKEFLWYEENIRQILEARIAQAFWQDNTAWLETGEQVNLSEFLRKLDEMGYEKVFKVEEPGEFSQIGGIVEVFPINLKYAVRIDFLGNKIESIEKLNIIVEDEARSKKVLKNKLKSQKLFSDLKNLKIGDFLTHLDHGVGRLLSIDKQYYILEYAKGDKLYVPLGLERKLTRYLGFREPKLSSLGSSLWQRTKQKIKKDAEQFARELLKIFAEKSLAERPALKAQEMTENLSASFEHPLTPDQKQAIADIEKDLEKEKPMDRIVCGDVGFGKTEVALRATAQVAENNKQVALIAPTTILAKQHFETFEKRLNGLPFNLKMLSRITPSKEKEQIIKELAQGQVDILIGTHSLLSKKVVFKNLGLLIIDDEQKFGVKQKEFLRKLNPKIDVLSLSATPIPRTLYMAFSSLRDISLIQTPPIGRKAIKTFVKPFDKEIIKQAIRKELKRKGQIYFLHNRVETIANFKKMLTELKTGASVGILHAKLNEKEIIKIINDFQNKKIDVLLATTIIENGLDISNANTLIVDNATLLGLAQAYQLRGRVGRSEKQSYAYFFYPKKQLKGLAKKRLQALKQAEELGSGYRIAMADLEIRGAGNILGREQSGSVNRVGLNLYCQMLSTAVEKLKN